MESESPKDNPQSSAPAQACGLIYKQLAAILAESGGIEKKRRNQDQGYAFRGIDDVYNELHELFGKHRVIVQTEVLERDCQPFTTGGGKTWMRVIAKVRYTYYAEDGSSTHDILYGEGTDNSDKATNKAMSAAQKYALLQKFIIPTEDGSTDPDKDTPPPPPQKLEDRYEKFDGDVPPFEGDWREYALERKVFNIPKGTVLGTMEKQARMKLAQTFCPMTEKASGRQLKGDLNLRGALDNYLREREAQKKAEQQKTPTDSASAPQTTTKATQGTLV